MKKEPRENGKRATKERTKSLEQMQMFEFARDLAGDGEGAESSESVKWSV